MPPRCTIHDTCRVDYLPFIHRFQILGCRLVNRYSMYFQNCSQLIISLTYYYSASRQTQQSTTEQLLSWSNCGNVYWQSCKRCIIAGLKLSYLYDRYAPFFSKRIQVPCPDVLAWTLCCKHDGLLGLSSRRECRHPC